MKREQVGLSLFFRSGQRTKQSEFFFFSGCFEGSVADCKTTAFPFFYSDDFFLFFPFSAAATETAEAVDSSWVISLLLQPFLTLSPLALLGKKRTKNAGERLAADDVTPPTLSRVLTSLSKAGTLRLGPVSKFGACINTAVFLGGGGGERCVFFFFSPSMSPLMQKVAERHKRLFHPFTLPPLCPSPPK